MQEAHELPLTENTPMSLNVATMEVACGYLTDVLTALAATDGPVVRTRDLEEAARQMARAAHRAELSESAVASWIIVASVTAFGTEAGSMGLVRQLTGWAAAEFAFVAVESAHRSVAAAA